MTYPNKRNKSLEEIITDLSEKLNTNFILSVESGILCTYKCLTCAVDKFCLAGLGTSVFKTRINNLRKGWLPCRCSSRFPWTKDQRELQIRDKAYSDSKGYKFIGWQSDSYSTASKIIMECPEHGYFYPSVCNFLKKHDCPGCSKTGFNKNKPAFAYVLIADSPTDSFVGYGITNVVKNRLRQHKSSLKKAGYVIVDFRVFSIDSQKAYKLEATIKEVCEKNPKNIIGFKTESTTLENFNKVVGIISSPQIFHL